MHKVLESNLKLIWLAGDILNCLGKTVSSKHSGMGSSLTL